MERIKRQTTKEIIEDIILNDKERIGRGVVTGINNSHNEDVFYIFYHETVLAIMDNYNKTIFINDTYYSVTTKKILGMIKNVVNGMIQPFDIFKVPELFTSEYSYIRLLKYSFSYAEDTYYNKDKKLTKAQRLSISNDIDKLKLIIDAINN